MKSAIATIFLAGMCASAGATNFVPLLNDAGIAISVDTDSIVPTRGFLEAWVTYDYRYPQFTLSRPPQDYTSIAFQEWFHCEDRRMGHVREIAFANNAHTGAPVYDQARLPAQVRMQDVSPGSFDGKTLEFVCTTYANKTEAAAAAATAKKNGVTEAPQPVPPPPAPSQPVASPVEVGTVTR